MWIKLKLFLQLFNFISSSLSLSCVCSLFRVWVSVCVCISVLSRIYFTIFDNFNAHWRTSYLFLHCYRIDCLRYEFHLLKFSYLIFLLFDYFSFALVVAIERMLQLSFNYNQFAVCAIDTTRYKLTSNTWYSSNMNVLLRYREIHTMRCECQKRSVFDNTQKIDRNFWRFECCYFGYFV